MTADRKYVLVERRGAVARITFNRPEKKNALSRDAIRVPHEELQEAAWQWGQEIARWDKTTLKFCKMAAHASMEAATVPAAAEIAWLMQQEHGMVNPKAYEGTRPFHSGKGSTKAK